jgi:hypothetical protein
VTIFHCGFILSCIYININACMCFILFCFFFFPHTLQYAVSIQRCYLVILDPKRIGEDDALVARLEVPKHLNFPLGFHGFWASDDK